MNSPVQQPSFLTPQTDGALSFDTQGTLVLEFIERVGGKTAQEQGVERRLCKSIEEAGEVSEAWLNLTGMNGKRKTPEDLQEEMVDVFVVLADTLFEHIRHLPAAYQSEGAWLTDSARLLIETRGQPAASYTHDDRFWKLMSAIVAAKQAKDATWTYGNVVRVRALGNAILEAYSASLDLMYTFVDGLSADKEGFDWALLAMLERKLGKWLKAISGSTNAVQQAAPVRLGQGAGPNAGQGTGQVVVQPAAVQ